MWTYTFLDRLVVTGFVKPEHRAMLLEAASPEDLLARFLAYQPPAIPKWITSAET
jgi:predicted Rossmann-fold nucleotide-binding protein